MDFGVGGYFLEQTECGDGAVYGDGQPGAQLIAGAEPVANPRESSFQCSDNLPDGGAVDVDFLCAACGIAEQRRDEDVGHVNSASGVL